MSKINFSKNDIESIATSVFEMILEEPEDYIEVSYEDLSSVMRKDYITRVQEKLNYYFEDELKNIDEYWSDKDTEILRLENENRRLREQLADINKTWSEDMGA